MSATRVEIQLSDSQYSFFCPASGQCILSAEEGFDFEAEHSPNLVFFINWVGKAWVPHSGGARSERYFQPLHEKLASEGLEDMAGVLSLLPPSAVLFRLFSAPGGGGHDGSECWVCIDFAITERQPVLMSPVA